MSGGQKQRIAIGKINIKNKIKIKKILKPLFIFEKNSKSSVEKSNNPFA